MEDLNRIKNIVRIGTISSVDEKNLTARVAFADRGIFVSGALHILQNQPSIPYAGVPQETESKGGGSGDSAYETHRHGLKITPWIPLVGQMVLCLYIPNGDGDGFILGGI